MKNQPPAEVLVQSLTDLAHDGACGATAAAPLAPMQPGAEDAPARGSRSSYGQMLKPPGLAVTAHHAARRGCDFEPAAPLDCSRQHPGARAPCLRFKIIGAFFSKHSAN